MNLKDELGKIIEKYNKSFNDKIYNNENDDHDLLMDIFSISPELKRENRQYWGRELGMCWQLLITEIARQNCKDFKPPIRVDGDEPVDLFIGKDAIDTKYRIGSGDSGTLKKFKKYGLFLKKQNYRPVLLILRDDNLNSAIKSCEIGGWNIYVGKDCLNYIKDKTKFDIEKYLNDMKNSFNIKQNKLK